MLGISVREKRKSKIHTPHYCISSEEKMEKKPWGIFEIHKTMSTSPRITNMWGFRAKWKFFVWFDIPFSLRWWQKSEFREIVLGVPERHCGGVLREGRSGWTPPTLENTFRSLNRHIEKESEILATQGLNFKTCERSESTHAWGKYNRLWHK